MFRERSPKSRVSCIFPWILALKKRPYMYIYIYYINMVGTWNLGSWNGYWLYPVCFMVYDYHDWLYDKPEMVKMYVEIGCDDIYHQITMAVIDIVRHEILIFTGSPSEILSPLAAIGVDPKGLEEKHRPTTLDQRCGRRRGLKSFLGCAETRTKHKWVMERLGTGGWTGSWWWLPFGNLT